MLERASLIIKKLQQLVDDNANPAILLTIAQMLVTELQQMEGGNTEIAISVTMPRKTLVVAELPKQAEVNTELFEQAKEEKEETAAPSFTAETEPLEELKTPPLEVIEELPTPITWFMQEQETPEVLAPREEFILELPEETVSEIEQEQVMPVAQAIFSQPLEVTPNEYLYNTPSDIPTLPEIEIPTELKESITETAPIEETDINSKFKEHKVEVAHLLENTHIKDLRKAISINDKYLFINELFGGDESLFDRSIKQIQSYSILPEATFWIQRELKIKLNWPADNEVVQLFDQLVKRRFS